MTVNANERKSGKKNAAANQKENFARSVNEIVAQLIIAHKKGKTVNLNKLKCDISSKYEMKNQPKLIDIIAAVPAEYKVVFLY